MGGVMFWHDRESVGVRMELLKYLDAEADKLHEENFSSSDEFRTVNHSFVEGFNYALAIVQGFEIELNENQQVVLDWLKWSVKEQGNSPMDAVYLLVLGETLVSVSLAYIALTPDQQTQVLAAFAEWGMKEVAE